MNGCYDGRRSEETLLFSELRDMGTLARWHVCWTTVPTQAKGMP